MENFKEIKQEILDRAKNVDACNGEYKRAYKAENYEELLKVVTDNFNFCCNNKIIDCELLSRIGESICNENNLFYNVSTDKGFLLADSATVRASGSATVEAWGSATVEAWGSATVRASGSATVEAWGSATVEASGSATVRASGSATVEAWGSATVEAWGSAYINSYNSIEHKISEKVILRYYYENRVVLADVESLKPLHNSKS
ncbi:hypothetical protein [Chryseobacterium defluvii]|uniref:Autotransporter adhesin-like protein n=1 Tax=Chryseobacterium defluvii TaxID=160396 RepID=A0A495SL87_9FLAO|nr:hypothetical protein [Chryseobacterium defluvii]RKT01059.1 hypothetical protein BCF58_0270 [Chryseobacterium defluvii]